MRRLARLVGNLLLAVSLAGAIYLIGAPLFPRPDGSNDAPAPPVAGPATPALPPPPTPEPAQPPTPEPTPPPAPTLAPARATPTPRPLPTATARPSPTPEPRLPITHLVLPRTGLEADVVPAPITEQHGVTNWEVPAFYAGHADGTAGAGQVGTAILFGHIVTLHSGNVFEHLDRARVGDEIRISSEDRDFAYRVDEVRAVARDDLSVLDPAEVPTVELITCTGTWDPTIWDYTERLVVRAVLEPPPSAGDQLARGRPDPPLPP